MRNKTQNPPVGSYWSKCLAPDCRCLCLQGVISWPAPMSSTKGVLHQWGTNDRSSAAAIMTRMLTASQRLLSQHARNTVPAALLFFIIYFQGNTGGFKSIKVFVLLSRDPCVSFVTLQQQRAAQYTTWSQLPLAWHLIGKCLCAVDI